MKRKYKKQLIIIGMMLCSSLLALSLIHFFDPARGIEKLRAENLEKELQQLESRIVEYQENYIEQNEEIRISHLLLGEKHDELERMNLHVRKLEVALSKLKKEGKTQKRNIRAIQLKLEEAKIKLIGMYKSEINALVADMSTLLRESEEKDREKEEMERMLSSIQSLYEDCSNEKLPEIKRDIDTINEQLPEGFYANNIRIEGISTNGRIIKLAQPQSQRRLQLLRISFDIDYSHPDSSKKPHAYGQYKLFAQIRHKKTEEVLSNKNQSSSGKAFFVNGERQLSSSVVLFDYQGSPLAILTDLNKESQEQKWTPGPYWVELYLQEEDNNCKIIGNTSIFLM